MRRTRSSADPVVLVTRRLFLRRFGLDDAARIYAMSREPGMAKWLPDQVYEDEGAALGVLRHLVAQYEPPAPERGPYVLGICAGSSGELIGHAGLSPIRGEVEVGYAVADLHQGRGYAAEAVEALADWGLRRFGLRRVLGIVSVGNVPSWKALERAGFILVDEAPGTLHGRLGSIRTYEKRVGSRALPR